MVNKKVNEWVEKVRGKLEKCSKGDKIRLCVAIMLIGIVMSVGAGFLGEDKLKEGASKDIEPNSAGTESKDNGSDNDTAGTDSLENRLKEMLANVEGVGDIEVLITYEDNGEKIPVENITQNNSDGQDQMQSDVVLEETDDGRSVAVRRCLKPSIRGVIVVADGVSNYTVKEEIISAVSAITGVGTHKIRVLERKGNLAGN